MNSLTLEEKRAQFHEFFTIKHTLNVNVKYLQADSSIPQVDELTQHMPYAFQIASEMSSLDSQTMRNLRNLGDHAKELTDFLNQQARKIDLMMSFILQQQDEPENRFATVEFGAGGLTIVSESQAQIGQIAELKVFLSEEAAAIFCFAEVIKCQPVDDKYHISLIYNRIREEDQELLVRASLHQQTLQLRARAKQQNKHAQ